MNSRWWDFRCLSKVKPSRAPQRDESNSHDIKVYPGYRAVSFDDANGFPRVIRGLRAAVGSCTRKSPMVIIQIVSPIFTVTSMINSMYARS
jgi:hypothetical protein